MKRAKVHVIRNTPSQCARRRAEEQARALGALDARAALSAARSLRGAPSEAYLKGFLSAVREHLGQVIDPAGVQSVLGKEGHDCGVEIVMPRRREAAERLFRRRRVA